MTVQVTPLQDRVLVRRLDYKEIATSGIIIPDTAKDKPQECVVIAVGAGKVESGGYRNRMDVDVGDRILLGKFTGNDIKIDDVDYLLVHETDILATVKRTDKETSFKK